MDKRVEAVRADKLIGRGTCSVVDECCSEAEIIEELDDLKITSPLEAIKYYRELEGLHMDKMLDCRWGEDSDPEIKIAKDWEKRKEEAGGVREGKGIGESL